MNGLDLLLIVVVALIVAWASAKRSADRLRDELDRERFIREVREAQERDEARPFDWGDLDWSDVGDAA